MSVSILVVMRDGLWADILLSGLLFKKLDMFSSLSHRGSGLHQGTVGVSLSGLGSEDSFASSDNGWVFGISVEQAARAASRAVRELVGSAGHAVARVGIFGRVVTVAAEDAPARTGV